MIGIVCFLAGAGVALAIARWSTRNQRAIQEKREKFLIKCIERADRFPGGRMFVRVPYNTFVTGTWMAEHSKHYPRKTYKKSVGVVESA